MKEGIKSLNVQKLLFEALDAKNGNFKNLALPGNPRYQPKKMANLVGYDLLYLYYAAVEVAMLKVLALRGKMSAEAMEQMNETVLAHVFTLSTSEADAIERKITNHDVRALVRLIQDKIPVSLRPYIHIPMTSYDVIDTAMAFWTKAAHTQVLKPLLKEAIMGFAQFTERYAYTVQIGRTHNKHALPITVGFWSAGILNRLITSSIGMDNAANGLIGCISGPVGAGNAVVGLGFQTDGDIEREVLSELGLVPGVISSQIVQPEPRSRYAFETLHASASLAQFGEDGRNLMRNEINEITIEKEKGAVGSSSMPHKTNPIIFESLCGSFMKNKAEFYKVLESLNSDHQRDLRNSALLRDMLTIPVNLAESLEKITKKNDKGQSFFERLVVNEDALQKNLKMSAHLVIAEPLYLALQQYGYPGDAHKFVNDTLTPLAAKSGQSLFIHLSELISQPGAEKELRDAVNRIPSEVKELFLKPESYIGYAPNKALEVVQRANEYLQAA
jgi:adenylosuccinate lyase